MEKTAEKWKSDRHRSENGILKRRWKNRTGPGVEGAYEGQVEEVKANVLSAV